MDQIYYTKNIEYSVKRGKRRKTVAIAINPEAQVIVRVPIFLSQDRIESIVGKKYRWILEKQRYFRQLATLYPKKEFVSGEQLLLFGRRYRLKVQEEREQKIEAPSLEGRRISVCYNKNLAPDKRRQEIEHCLTKWYFAMAKDIVRDRIQRYSQFIGVKPKEIKIKDQEKRWGSCSSNGVLRFNWRIAMSPVSIIDYIVVHELCHLKVKSHSADFWKQVGMVLPDYQRRREWLRNNSAMVRI